jgi:hypothetical protein
MNPPDSKEIERTAIDAVFDLAPGAKCIVLLCGEHDHIAYIADLQLSVVRVVKVM